MSSDAKKFEIIAEICHIVNKAYCDAIGDLSQTPWNDAPDWQKESAINGVKFHMENDVTPEQSHESWMKQKLDDGWVYGAKKNVDKKEHPCMVLYSDLPEEQRMKDKLFKAVVDSFKEQSV